MYILNKDGMIHQGDIFKDILLLNLDYDPTQKDSGNKIKTQPIKTTQDYILVLSQECDLKNDSEEREIYLELYKRVQKALLKIDSLKEPSFEKFSNECFSFFNRLKELKRDNSGLKKFEESHAGLFIIQKEEAFPKKIQKINEILNKIDSFLCEDPFIPNILVAPIYLPDQFKKGQQIKYQRMKNRNDEFKEIQNNDKYKRFHFLRKWTHPSAPEGVIDFKHFFTVPRNVLYTALKQGNYVATLNTPYKEALSQRFAYYLSRIGLPEVNAVENLQ
jgi:hypothetical protein